MSNHDNWWEQNRRVDRTPRQDGGYTQDDHDTASQRVREARERLLADPAASAAHQALTAEIEGNLSQALQQARDDERF